MGVATRKTDSRARITLPDDFANETVVVERISDNEVRVRRKLTLSQLLAKVTPENIHGEVDFGPPVGSESL